MKVQFNIYNPNEIFNIYTPQYIQMFAEKKCVNHKAKDY